MTFIAEHRPTKNLSEISVYLFTSSACHLCVVCLAKDLSCAYFLVLCGCDICMRIQSILVQIRIRIRLSSVLGTRDLFRMRKAE